jgi:MerR family mercuric resistance operon transcriptional regulator
MKIGAVAEAVGVGIQTIRFYEQQGLLPNPPRKPSGYRVYSPDIIRRVLFIKRAKELGFSLAEISELLSFDESDDATAKDVKGLADKKLIDLKDKIRSLQRMQRALQRLADDCPGSGPKSCCSILGSLADEKRGNGIKT